ncbi:geranylgeranyl diphosphate synthase type II [Stella humosa]|uniref:Geranylgeranyl diphosphate synthase type II n=1 Tax=Stella humosa TaxID=94 RepID=A0A3N1KUH0_9PROT|nr:polyprenyl synthetase family protein [Stella humosa]ROP81005.1 geranylgeranyl diphosphate synthase type II [Stella humosa]BBK29694.1 farnesyl-diphosphate synthase [Stella humosa]
MPVIEKIRTADAGWLRHRVDGRLRELLGAKPGIGLHAAMADATLRGGRRLRATLTLLSCRAVGGQDEDALDLACAVEMVHSASLALDDLPAMDDASERRGEPSLHRRHGEATTILAAIALLARAFEITSACDHARGTDAVARLARTIGEHGMCAGQFEDLVTRRSGRAVGLDVHRIETLHRRKSGCIVATACELGAVAGGGGVRAADALAEYGMRLGIAYQIIDDLADHARDAAAGQPNYAATAGAMAARDRVRHLLVEAGRIVRGVGIDPAAIEAYVEGLVAGCGTPDGNPQ